MVVKTLDETARRQLVSLLKICLRIAEQLAPGNPVSFSRHEMRQLIYALEETIKEFEKD